MGNPEYSEYRKFLRAFLDNYDPNHQPTVRVPGCQITNEEVIGQVLSWTDQYLTDRSFPDLMKDHILNVTIAEVKIKFLSQSDKQKIFTPMKLAMETLSLVNSICKDIFENNRKLEKIPLPTSLSKAPPLYSVASLKNHRRLMEDRHVIVNDLNTIFGIESQRPVSFYGVFDGHSGPDAALYGATHLHCHLAESPQYLENPAEALREAFKKTDANLALKNLNSGSTAVCALYSPGEKQLYVGWVGDSKALLVTNRNIMQLVTPHKPDLPEEKTRIESSGGIVMNFSGIFRVNGVLAVSRALGDFYLRPWVIPTPDIVCVPLTGDEDFLILACDGLWDHVTEDVAALLVYKILDEIPNYKDDPNMAMESLNTAAKELALFAKKRGSTDNISIIVVYLKHPFLSTGSRPSAVNSSPLDKMEAAFENTTCTDFTNSNQEVLPPPNNVHKLEVGGFEVEEDLGPETDVDAVDEAILGTISKDDHIKLDSNKKVELFNEAIQPLDNNVKDDIFKSDILELTNNHHIDDNKLLETVTEEFCLNHKDKKLDFSEKREYSFEREECEKEIHTASDLTIETLDPITENHVETKPDAETYIVPEPNHEPTVDQTAAENVVVPESGEESEDEWNYVKIETREIENDKKETESQEDCTDLLHQEQIDDPEIKKVEDNGCLEEEITEDDMSSQLNPDAEEFVPKSPLRTTPLSSPFSQETQNLILMADDPILAQSPRKFKPLKIESVPSEDDFENEIAQRPGELDDTEHQRPGSSSSQCSYQEMNLKEAMHGDEKQEFAAETGCIGETDPAPVVVAETEIKFTTSDKIIDVDNDGTFNGDHENLHKSLAKSMLEQDPMSVSFYNDGTTNSINPFSVDLNAVHQLPSSDEEGDSDKENLSKNGDADNAEINGISSVSSELTSPQNDPDEISKPEDDQYSALLIGYKMHDRISPDQYNQSDKPESELISTEALEQCQQDNDKANDVTSALSDLTLSDQTVSPQYEAEHFVEDIKNENGSDEKYVESGLSPTANEFHPFKSVNGLDVQFEFNSNESAESDICLQDQYKLQDKLMKIESPLNDPIIDGLATAEIELAVAQPDGNKNIVDSLENELENSAFTHINNIVPETTSTFTTETDNIVRAEIKDMRTNTDNTLLDLKSPKINDLCQFDNATLLDLQSTNTDILCQFDNTPLDLPPANPEDLCQIDNSTLLPSVLAAPEPQADDVIKSLETNVLSATENKVQEILTSEQIVEITKAFESETPKQETVKTESNVTNEFNDRIDRAEENIEIHALPNKESLTGEKQIKPEESVESKDLPLDDPNKLAAETTIAAAKVVAAKTAIAAKGKKIDPKTKVTGPPVSTVTKKAVSSTAAASSVKSRPITATTKPAVAPPKPAPIAKPRTATSVSSAPVTNKPLDKKPLSATATSKKPLLNGDIKSTTSLASKRSSDPKPSSSTTTTSKTTNSSIKSTSRPALTAKTISATTTTTSKPQTIVGRPASITKTATAKPSTIASSASTTTKPKVTLSISNTVAKATSARLLSSPNKPVNDKLAKETTNKQVSTTRTTSALTGTNKTATSPKSSLSAATLKKTEVIKSPTGAKTIAKSMSSTTTKKTITNGPTSVNNIAATTNQTANKKTATSLTTRTSLAPPQKRSPLASSPNKKASTTVTNTKSPKTTTVEKPTSAGNIATAEQVTKTIDSLIIETSAAMETVAIGNNLIENNINSDQPMNAVIDSSAD